MTQTTIERRGTPGVVELRKAGDGPVRMGGYALKFNTLSRNLGGFVETIAPGFLAKSEGDGWPGVMARWNHDNAYLLGTTAAETLRLLVDDIGLDYEVDPPSTSYAADLAALLERGDVQKSSFAFRTFDDDWSLSPEGFPLRSLISGGLVDVAPVNDPAYQDTSSGLRSLAEKRGVDIAEVAQLAAAGELRKLIKASPKVIDLGANKTVARTANDVREALCTAVDDAYGGQDVYVWVRDYDPDAEPSPLVYFEVSGDAEPRGTFQQAYELAADGTASLAGDRIEVTARTTYTPVSEGGRQGDTHPLLSLRLRQAELMARRNP